MKIMHRISLALPLCFMALFTNAQSTASQPVDSAPVTTAADTTIRQQPVSADTDMFNANSAPQPQDYSSTSATATNLLVLCALSALLSILALAVAANANRRNKAKIRELQRGINALKKDIESTKTEFLDALNSKKLLPSATRQTHTGTAAARPLPPHRDKASVKTQPVIKKATAEPEPITPKQLYLPRPDANGVFPRATATFENGNSIFTLTTTDGLSGTFEVVDSKEMQRIALMMPTANLTNACTGHNIQTSSPGYNRIVTDQAGIAIFDGGHWHVKTKAVIHYEA